MPDEEKTELLFAAIERKVQLDWLEAERDNFRAALQWSINEGDAETALRLVNTILPLWETRGPMSEGSRWLEGVWRCPGQRSEPRAWQGAFGAASLAWLEGDIASACPWLEESASIYRDLGEKRGLASSLGVLGICLQFQGDFALATAPLEEVLSLFREIGDRESISWNTYLAGRGGHQAGQL